MTIHIKIKDGCIANKITKIYIGYMHVQYVLGGRLGHIEIRNNTRNPDTWHDMDAEKYAHLMAVFFYIVVLRKSLEL